MSIPCKECLVYTQCKARLYAGDAIMRGVIGIARSEKCPELAFYLLSSSYSRDAVNATRKVFGLPEIDYPKLEKQLGVTNLPDFKGIEKIAMKKIRSTTDEDTL